MSNSKGRVGESTSYKLRITNDELRAAHAEERPESLRLAVSREADLQLVIRNS